MNPAALDAYLGMLAGRADPNELLELRRRLPSDGMASEFHPIHDREQLARAVMEHAGHTDVYIGCAPRTRAAGTKDAIRHVWVLWAECDGARAVEAARSFRPAPSVIIGSGSGSNCHAYWPLIEPLSAPAAEVANLRLAAALGADLACFDASRILRPPGTWNYKREPPTPVVAMRMAVEQAFVAADVVRNAPPVNEERIAHRWRPQPRRGDRADPLLGIDPAVYVSNLVGRWPGRNHKVACPFHEDRRPSLHVFPTPERGWCCFSCGRGGSIYDLAAALWGVTPRGREFLQLRRELLQRFAGDIERARVARGLERT
jgi:CHC2 zinc finger/RepB DNA-primase from phage plasmid